VLFLCPRCGRPAQPQPYFNRGVNVAKALFLMIPLSFFGPLFLFFLRKDRLICGACKGLLGTEVAMPLLQGFSATADGRALATVTGPGGAALAIYDPEEDLTVLERQSRHQRTQAWTLGAVSAGLMGLGLVSGADGNVGAPLMFLAMGAPAGIAAALAAFRSRAFGKRAAAKRGREQRARVLELARASGGRITVSLVATDLRIELADAEALLNSMVDGLRVEMEVDDAGRISYLFTELAGG
jgi:hypothetical protein